MKESQPFEKADRDSVEGRPHIWIQWKGTNVCADVHCACGYHGHLDADFMHFVRCHKCGRTYQVGQSVPIYELPADNAEHPERTRVIQFGDADGD